MTSKSRGYFVAKQFKYGEEDLEMGQVFEPRGSPNDAALISVKYLVEIKEAYPGGYEEFACTRCGKVFVAPEYKGTHDVVCPMQVLDTNEVPEAAVKPDPMLVGQATSQL